MPVVCVQAPAFPPPAPCLPFVRGACERAGSWLRRSAGSWGLGGQRGAVGAACCCSRRGREIEPCAAAWLLPWGGWVQDLIHAAQITTHWHVLCT